VTVLCVEGLYCFCYWWRWWWWWWWWWWYVSRELYWQISALWSTTPNTLLSEDSKKHSLLLCVSVSVCLCFSISVSLCLCLVCCITLS